MESGNTKKDKMRNEVICSKVGAGLLEKIGRVV